jgi:protein-disulfide isomerase
MKKIHLSLLSCASLVFINAAFAEEIPIAKAENTPSHFTPQQTAEIKKIMTQHIMENPDLVMVSFQAGMAAKQKEEVTKMEKAFAENKDKILKDKSIPVGGNLEGKQSLVVFLDPSCGYCKKFHTELDTLLNKNQDLKVTYIDIPILGPGSTQAIKAMLAANAQGKYEQLQKAIFAEDKGLTKKQLLKLANSLGIDTKKLEKDMKSKEIEAQLNRNSDLAKAIGVNGTPTLIISESKVVPGYMSADELNNAFKEVAETVKAAAK